MALSVAVLAAPAPPQPTIELKADNLTAGALTSWPCTGSVSGTFDKQGTAEIKVETVAGKKAVTFGGANGLQSSFGTPAALGGKNPWTVAVWIYNPAVGAEENFLQWSRINSPVSTGASFGYGTSGALGASIHWGNDHSYERSAPDGGKWHLITYTYEGTATKRERVWVDGMLNTEWTDTATNENNIVTDGQFVNVGRSIDRPSFSGSIASLQIWGGTVLTMEQIIDLYTGGGGVMPADPVVVNGSTELPNYGGGLQASQQIPGWGNSNKVGMAGRNAITFNNGVNPDGNQVLAIWDGGVATQYISNFKAGRTYHLVFYANAKNGSNTPTLDVRMNGTSLTGFPKQISAVDPAGTYQTAFTKYEAEWTAPSDGMFALEFAETITPSTAPAANTIAYGVLIDAVSLYDTVSPAKPMLSAAALNYFSVEKNSTVNQIVTLSNEGGADLSLSGITLTGADASQFAVASPTTFPVTVPKFGGKVAITVNYSPKAYTEAHNAVLNVTTGAGALTAALSGFCPDYPLVINNSFETPPYFTYLSDNLVIPGWAPKAIIGVGMATRANPHFNNGAVPDGAQVLWIQNRDISPELQEVSQMIAGFHAGKKCKISLYVNARAQLDNKAGLKVIMNGTVLTSETITQVGANNPFLRKDFDFTPPADSAYLLEIGCSKGYDDSSLLVDKVNVVEYGAPPEASIQQSSLAFTGVKPYLTTSTVTIYNNGGSDLHVTGLSILNDSTSQFRVISPTPLTVAPFGASNTIVVGYKPRTVGTVSGPSLKIVTDATSGTFNVALSGTATNMGVTLINGSFEDPVFASQTNLGDSLVIPGWAPAPVGGVGVAITSNPHFDNGAVPDGKQVLWIQGGQGVSQLLSGFAPGMTYHISMSVNARAILDLSATMSMKIGGIPLFGGVKDIAAVNTRGGAFQKFEQDFVANAPAMLLEIAQSGTKAGGAAIDDSTLLIDNIVLLQPSPDAVKSWSLFE